MTKLDELKEIIRFEMVRQNEIWRKCFDRGTIETVKDWGESLQTIRDAVEHLGVEASEVIRFTGKDGREHSVTLGWLQETFEIAQNPGEKEFAPRVKEVPGILDAVLPKSCSLCGHFHPTGNHPVCRHSDSQVILSVDPNKDKPSWCPLLKEMLCASTLTSIATAVAEAAATLQKKMDDEILSNKTVFLYEHERILEDPWFEDLAASIEPLNIFFGTSSRDEIIKWGVAQKSSFVTRAICMYLGARDIVTGRRVSSEKLQKKGFVIRSPMVLPGIEGYLKLLRNEGWMVAVHNDYRQNGEMHTFWLFTHTEGRYLKGERKTDEEALALCWKQLQDSK